MVDHKALGHCPSDVVAGYEQALDAQQVEELGKDAGLHFDGAVKAVPLIGIAIADEIRNDELEVLREEPNAIFPQVPPDGNPMDQEEGGVLLRRVHN
jgi:hypothetical protein